MESKRVLIVDDDSDIRRMVRSILEAEGYEVVEADDGLKAVSVLANEPRPINFRMVVLDVMMPGMNGLDVLTRIKLHSDTSKIPVLMLTAEARTEDLMAGYAQGAEYYVTKPFTRQQLLYGLSMVLGEAKEE